MKLLPERAALDTTAMFVFAALVGALSGVLAFVFQILVELTQNLATGESGTILEAAHSMLRWRALVLPAVGGLVAALIIRLLAPRSKPFGIPGILEAISVRSRQIKGGPILVRALASIAVIGSGGSVGREGAIVQLAAAMSSKVARVVQFEPRRHSLLVGCGVAAGMAAAYNAPLAGAFFVMEVILASFAIDVFAPLVISSVFATLVIHAISGSDAAVYRMPAEVEVGSWGAMMLALALGLPAGVISVLFQRTLRASARFFARFKAPLEVKFTLAGLAVGAIGTGYPEIFGNGYSTTNKILFSSLPLATVAAVLVLKPCATALLVGAGAPGGVFTPAILTGASLGALFHALVTWIFPSFAAPSATFTVIGMAALIAGITHAPIMSMILLVELTHDLGLVLPLVLATVASSLVAKWLGRDSIFNESLRARGVPIDVGIEELTLRRIRVRDLLRSGLVSVPVHTTLDEILDRFRVTRLDVIYVVGEGGEFRGEIDLHDVKDLLNRAKLGPVVIAADVMETPPMASPDTSIAELLEVFDDPEREELPVVEARDGKRILIGRLTRRDVIASLNLEVLQTQTRRTRIGAVGNALADTIELPEGFEIAELPLPERLRGTTLAESGLRDAKGVTVLSLLLADGKGKAKKRSADPAAGLEGVVSLIVMGQRQDIEGLRQKIQGEVVPDDPLGPRNQTWIGREDATTERRE